MNREEWEHAQRYTHKNPDDLYGERVRVHWHFQERRYSLSVKVPGIGWRVLRNPTTLDVTKQWDHEPYQTMFGKVVLSDATFKVSQAGRKRAVREKRRNVHAWVEGVASNLIIKPDAPMISCGDIVRYSPFSKHTTFYKGTPNFATPVYTAEMVSLGIVDDKAVMIAVGINKDMED